MPTCFVIQPFDSGKFEKRFNDVFKPALEEVGFEPYRVDKDPHVDIPIDAIEEGIRKATICLADISTNNPNVWYELGYAFATGRPVIMLCSNERDEGRFPFDIQHRTIIEYTSESPSDFENLRRRISERATALQKRAETRKFIENEQVAPQEGVSAIEIQALALAAAQVGTLTDSITTFRLKHEAMNSGFTGVGFALALKRLESRQFIRLIQETNVDEETHSALVIEEPGWNWMDEHAELFVLQRKDKGLARRNKESAELDEDVPF